MLIFTSLKMIFLLLLLSLLGFSARMEATVHELPELWPTVSTETSSYHVRYHLEMNNNPEILTVEEWASFDEQLFRLDLISSTGRVSYLSYGRTGEMFRYKPFTCKLLTDQAQDLKVFSNLFIGYPLVGPKSATSTTTTTTTTTTTEVDPLIVYGLGPLWLRARKDAQQVEFRQADQLNPVSIDGKHRLSVDFDKYLVQMPANTNKANEKLRLLFLFPVGVNHFVEMIDWLVGDQLVDVQVKARIKLIDLDLSPLEGSAVFDLPVGYGCRRGEKYEQEFNLDLGLNLLHKIFPNQVSLGITTSQPNDQLASSSSSWSTNKFSVSLTRDSLARPGAPKTDQKSDQKPDRESYFVSLVQQRDEQTGRLRRTKRVWWLPTEKVDSTTQALVYEMDLSSLSCQVSHRNVHDQLVLSFPTKSNVHEELNSKQMVLSMDQILFLLDDNANYHQITRMQKVNGSIYDQQDGAFKNIYFEKRLTKFKLTSDGSVAWSGPVSIVKQVNSYTRYINQIANKNQKEDSNDRTRKRPNKRLALADEYKTSLTLFFYSDQFETLYYKAVIELLGNHDVDYAYLHKQLDISSCVPEDRQKSIVIKYPMEDPNLMKQLEAKQEFISTQLYQNLFFRTVFIPLQITNLETSFDYFNMQVRATILDLPLTHTFELKKGFKLIRKLSDESEKAQNILEFSTTSNADKCGERCELLNCFRFSYDTSNKQCHVELVANKAEAAESPSSDMYSFVRRSFSLSWRGSRLDHDLAESSRPHLNARSIINLLEGTLINDQSEVDFDGLNPLNIRLKLESATSSSGGQSVKKITLRPASIESDYESMNEYIKEIDESPQDSSDVGGDVVKFEGQFQQLYYTLLMEDRAFSKGIGVTMDGLASYEECARYCEQNDCRSFSYCQQDEQCRVTNFHHDKFIDMYSEGRPLSSGCNLYSLDYLSKFEPYGRVMAPTKYREMSDGSSPRDCANMCMDQQSFACQGFYFCHISAMFASGGGFAPPGIRKCYLMDKHVNSFINFRAISFDEESSKVDQKAGSHGAECSLYSRSYLAHFDKFYAKKIDFSAPTTGGQEKGHFIPGMDVEYCANRCTQLGCLAFDICPSSDEGSLLRQTCHFATESISRAQLKDEPKCTTFVVSDKSQFNKNKVKLIEGLRPDSPAAESVVDDKGAPQQAIDTSATPTEIEMEQQKEVQLEKDDINADLIDKLSPHSETDASKSSGGSGWLARLWRFTWSLGLGVCSGGLFVLVWNEAYARGWFDGLAHRIGSVTGTRRM